ncbi:PLP-dependent aminotransferase family protein [Thermomonospora umbrina]|uniref:GntR family transcriptional regulator/MocR family aminotransferase n=1 Tax=Thermomonospora umbrina TaxID=111806 RepID=A0A3D9SS73_9ACTN|nr:PLP-dependent aminotransferase family protein [Thermomonospora umbrina]REE95815.1 GntR family transcriptional regulator/MocR family aminotransferase [Thermomonospora umbrina]
MAKERNGRRPRVHLDLPLLLDRTAAEPLTAQLIAQLRTAVREGRLTAGERLPASRALATTLGVSRTVVMDAFAQLYAEGWLDGRHGSGTYVADVHPVPPPPPDPETRGCTPGTTVQNPDGAPLVEGYLGGEHGPGAPTGARPRTSGTTRRAPYCTEHSGAERGSVRGLSAVSGANGLRAVSEERPFDGSVGVENGDGVPQGCVDLRPGVAWVGDLDTPAWRRAWRMAASVAAADRADPWGLPGLRAELCEHMRRSRGVTCGPEQVVVTRGATNALDMLAATVLRPGDRVGLEEPGYLRAHAVMASRGAEVVPCPVDEHGLVVEGLPEGLRLVYTTPSHQYPLGGVLPVPRRQALLAWARRTGALVVEDDYDGEFRYDVASLPALYGLDPETVVYLGTMSKRLAADIGVGWLAATPRLAAAVTRRRRQLNDRTAPVPQEAVRLLLERGDLDRHIGRMRAEYARRRAVVVEAFEGLRLHGDTAGLHLVVELPGTEVRRIMARALDEGVLLDSLERNHVGPPSVTGLVIGYSATGLADLRDGCRLVRALIDET